MSLLIARGHPTKISAHASILILLFSYCRKKRALNSYHLQYPSWEPASPWVPEPSQVTLATNLPSPVIYGNVHFLPFLFQLVLFHLIADHPVQSPWGPNSGAAASHTSKRGTELLGDRTREGPARADVSDCSMFLPWIVGGSQEAERVRQALAQSNS